MKTITLLLDGAGDRSYDVLGGKTPLAYANTPNLDEIAKRAQCGLMTPLEEGVSLGTDLAHMILFGYRPEEYPNRSIIDAVGEGLALDGSELVLRASFADVERTDSGFMLRSRFTKALNDEAISRLIQAVNCEIEGYRFECIHSYDSHCFVTVKPLDGKRPLCAQISDSDPFYAPQYVMAVEPFETNDIWTEYTSGLVNQFLKRTYARLDTHEVNEQRRKSGLECGNFILTKWAGQMRPIEPFPLRSGMTGQLIGKSKLLNGLSDFIGMDYLKYTDFANAIGHALDSKHEYVHLHTKDPDEASHRKDPFDKVRALEQIDKELGPLLDFEGLLIVTADHSTPCDGEMIHSGESVPFMARGKYVRRDTVKCFNEIDCSAGSIRLNGTSFMKYVQNATDRGNLYHLRAGNRSRNYRPVEVNRLR